MALDIRLDFISNIGQEYIDRMSAIRAKFIEIDNELKAMADEALNNPAGARCVALARTHNEQACQSAIKSLCILGENK